MSSSGWPSGGRDVRRRQHGLMLLTAHRAKGLEFDHVAVLDGGWEGRSAKEDPDAPPSALLRGHDSRSSDPRVGALRRSARWPGTRPLQDTRSPSPRRTVAPATACPSGERSGSLPVRLDPPAGDPGACPSLSAGPVWVTSTWALRGAARPRIPCMAPSPPCPRATRWRCKLDPWGRWELRDGGGQGSGATSPSASNRRPTGSASPPLSARSWCGVAKRRSPATGRVWSARAGRSWFRNSYSTDCSGRRPGQGLYEGGMLVLGNVPSQDRRPNR